MLNIALVTFPDPGKSVAAVFAVVPGVTFRLVCESTKRKGAAAVTLTATVADRLNVPLVPRTVSEVVPIGADVEANRLKPTLIRTWPGVIDWGAWLTLKLLGTASSVIVTDPEKPFRAFSETLKVAGAPPCWATVAVVTASEKSGAGADGGGGGGGGVTTAGVADPPPPPQPDSTKPRMRRRKEK